MSASQIVNQRPFRSVAVSFVRLGGVTRRSPHLVSRPRSAAVIHLCAATDVELWEGLLSEEAISAEGMKMLNGVFRRYMKLKDGRKDLRQSLKKMLEHEPLQFAIGGQYTS